MDFNTERVINCFTTNSASSNRHTDGLNHNPGLEKLRLSDFNLDPYSNKLYLCGEALPQKHPV